jgi:hypothetical protein
MIKNCSVFLRSISIDGVSFPVPRIEVDFQESKRKNEQEENNPYAGNYVNHCAHRIPLFTADLPSGNLNPISVAKN